MKPTKSRPAIPSHTWQPCEPGELVQLCSQAKRYRRRRFLVQTSASVAGLLAVGATAVYLFSDRSSTKPSHYPLTCVQAKELRDAFVKQELPDDTKQSVLQHLAKCAVCKEFYRLVDTSIS